MIEFLFIVALLLSHASRAAETPSASANDAVSATASPRNPDDKLKETPPSPKAASQEDTQNNRMKTEEGSKSPLSGQFNLTYYGSSLDHPFSEFAPNSGNTEVPPLVTISGTVSARYRIDKKTTTGLGTGVTTQTPFQGPKNTTVANPYADVARSFRWGPIQNRADFQFTLWTEQQLHSQYGQGIGLSLIDEAFYESSFGLTSGLAFEIDFNTFSNDPQFASPAIRVGQVSYDIYPEPYFEYALSKRLNLRSVVGIGWDHNRSLNGFFTFYGPKVYQTLGLGISASDAVFLYPYLKGYPYSGTLGVKTTTIGLNAIVNLF
ncbi:MAG: hypothetical protein ACXVB9_06010 [Bdellovibrionota bacterium]